MERRLRVFSIALCALASLSGGVRLDDGFGPGAAAGTEAGAQAARVAEVGTLLMRQLPRLAAEHAEALAPVIVADAQRAGLDPALVVAVIHVESGGDRYAISRVGALGLMQLRPGTGEAMARRLGLGWNGPATLFDPVANVRLGIGYLGRLLQRFGDLPTALAAYNEGPTRVSHRLRRGEPAPAGYATRVLARFGDHRARTPAADAV